MFNTLLTSRYTFKFPVLASSPSLLFNLTVKFLSAITNPVTGEDVSVNWCKYLAGSTREISTRTSFPYHNSTVMFGSTKNSQGSLVGLDIETGEQKWEYVNIDIPIASSGDNPVNQYHSENKAYLLDSP